MRLTIWILCHHSVLLDVKSTLIFKICNSFSIICLHVILGFPFSLPLLTLSLLTYHFPYWGIWSFMLDMTKPSSWLFLILSPLYATCILWRIWLFIIYPFLCYQNLGVISTTFFLCVYCTLNRKIEVSFMILLIMVLETLAYWRWLVKQELE